MQETHYVQLSYSKRLFQLDRMFQHFSLLEKITLFPLVAQINISYDVLHNRL